MNRTYWLAWLPLPVIGIINGGLRVALYQNTLGDTAAHQLSCLTGILLFAAYAWFIAHRWPFAGGRQALIVGLTWMGLTIAFEFGMGIFVLRQPLSVLLADYNVAAGRFWLLVLLTIGSAPYLAYRLGGRAPSISSILPNSCKGIPIMSTVLAGAIVTRAPGGRRLLAHAPAVGRDRADHADGL